jgi:hypothetical protein
MRDLPLGKRAVLALLRRILTKNKTGREFSTRSASQQSGGGRAACARGWLPAPPLHPPRLKSNGRAREELRVRAPSWSKR